MIWNTFQYDIKVNIYLLNRYVDSGHLFKNIYTKQKNLKSKKRPKPAKTVKKITDEKA